MRFGGHPSHAGFGPHAFGGAVGGRAGALPFLLHVFGIFFLVIMGMAVAALAHSLVREWVQRRYRNAAYADMAGMVAVIFVIIAGGWLLVKILSF